MIEVAMAQDHGFCRRKIDTQFVGIMEEAVRGEPGIEKDRVLLLSGEDPDKAGEAVLCEEQTARIERQSTVNRSRRRYKDVKVVVDEDGHVHPVCR